MSEMRDVLYNPPEGSLPILLAGLDAYGPFYRIAPAGSVNGYGFIAAQKHLDAGENVARAVLAGFVQSAMEAACGGETISLNYEFLGNARAGERIEAHVETVRHTRSLAFLGSRVTADGRAVLTADGLIARA